MKTIRIMTLAGFMTAFIGQTWADTTEGKSVSATIAVADSSAVIKGRIIDNQGEVLAGATIRIEKDGMGTISDINGYYTLSRVKAGKHKLLVSYVGYESKEIEVKLTKGKTSIYNITLSEGVALKEVQIKGALNGQRKAYNMQHQGMGVINIVSSDQTSKYPDSNIGDALKRINGINVQYDQGEARFGQVRGTSPDLSSVTVNGNRMPSAEGDTRSVQLDLIPTDMIQTIEVNKVVTSDMDGDAIGGSINLVTKNSPYRRTFNATVGSGWNFISDKAPLDLGLTYGDRFFGNKLGMMAAATYQNAPAGSDNTEFEYIVKKDQVVLDNAQIRQYYVTRRRQSYSLSFDYDINANNRLTLKGIYNRRDDWENRYRITYKDISKGEGAMSGRIQTKGSSANNRDARLELQQTMDLAIGGEHQLGNVKLNWGADYSRATEDRPNERYFDLQLKKQTFTFTDQFNRQPYTTSTIDPTDGGKWSIKEITNSDREIAENDYKAHLDLELPLLKGLYASKLKAGIKYSTKTKSRETRAYDYTDWYKSTYGQEYENNYTLQVRDGFMPGSQYQKANFVSREYLGSLNLDPANGTFIKENASTNFDATEHITAAYLRYDQKLGERMNLMLGLRMEATNLTYSGLMWEVNEDTEEETLTPTGESHNNYINLLPSILWKWDINKQWLVRASFTETLSRPKYSYLIPSAGVNSHSESRTEVTLGNPDLKPAVSYNLDLSTEYYFQQLGLVSAGLFYKRINGFVVNEVTNGNYKKWNDCEITTPVNGFDGNLYGLELGLSRDFGFITPALRCIGFDGNYTLTGNSVATCRVGNKSEQILPGTPEQMLNASIYFDKAGFKARVSYNYTSAFQDDEEYQSDSRLRRYYDATSYLDVNLSYTLGRKFKTTFYCDFKNLTNQPLRYYIGGQKDCTTQVEYYAPKINVGIKIAL